MIDWAAGHSLPVPPDKHGPPGCRLTRVKQLFEHSYANLGHSLGLDGTVGAIQKFILVCYLILLYFGAKADEMVGVKS